MKSFDSGRQPKKEVVFPKNVSKIKDKSSFSNLQQGATRHAPVEKIKLWGSR